MQKINGHLCLSTDARERLLKISPTTVDRIHKPDRDTMKLELTTTHSGNLFKHQIQVRTFIDWDDVIPDFIEAVLITHCGGNTNGAFLNILTLDRYIY